MPRKTWAWAFISWAAPSKSAPGWTIEKARTNSTRQAPGTRHNGQGRAAAAPTPAGAWQRKPSDLPLEAGFKDF